MLRVREFLLFVLAIVLPMVLLAPAQTQAAEERARSDRRGPRGMGYFSADLLGLARTEQVQKELKLNDEQKAKVKEISDKLRAEAREQYAGLREIEDEEQRRAKMAELRDQREAKSREQLREVLPREQLIRLYQIRLQIAGPVYGLNNEYVANRLKLTPEQKEKAAEIDKTDREKRYELFRSLRGLSREEIGKKMTEMRDKVGKIRKDAAKQALELLADEQKEAYESLKGEKFELQRPG